MERRRAESVLFMVVEVRVQGRPAREGRQIRYNRPGQPNLSAHRKFGNADNLPRRQAAIISALPLADAGDMKLPGPTPSAFDGSAARSLGNGPQERRRSDRVPQRTTAWLSSVNGGVTTGGRTVTVEDLSLHGVGFSTDQACAVGEKQWILITQGPMRLSTRVKIVSVRPAEDGSGTWFCGGEFF